MTTAHPASSASQLRLAVLLLAAGEGKRLGSYPKALLKKDGKTLFQRHLEAVKPFSPVEFILLTGFHAELIEANGRGFEGDFSCPIKIIRNANPERGQSSSIRLGLESLESSFDILLVALSDQPLITHIEITQLLEAFNHRAHGEEIILPMNNDRRGNPVIFSRLAILNILAEPGLVCRTYMDAHPEQVHLMNVLSEAFMMDIDTPEDMQALGFTST